MYSEAYTSPTIPSQIYLPPALLMKQTTISYKIIDNKVRVLNILALLRIQSPQSGKFFFYLREKIHDVLKSFLTFS